MWSLKWVEFLSRALILLNSHPWAFISNISIIIHPPPPPNATFAPLWQASSFCPPRRYPFHLFLWLHFPLSIILQSSHHLLHSGDLIKGRSSNWPPLHWMPSCPKVHQVGAKLFLWKPWQWWGPFKKSLSILAALPKYRRYKGWLI